MMLTAVNSNLRIPFLSVALKNGRVRIDEIHRARLRLLIQEKAGGKQATFAGLIGKAPAQVSQWINASKDSTTGKRRAMDRNTAREIERKVALPDGWMDQPLDLDEIEALQAKGKPASGKGVQSGANENEGATGGASTPTSKVRDAGKGPAEAPQDAHTAASPTLIPPAAAVFNPTNLSAAVFLMAKLLEGLDARSRKTMGRWLKELASNPSKEAPDVAYKAEALARAQRISNNRALNEAFSGNGEAVETQPATLES